MLIQRDVLRYGDDPATAEDFRVVWVHAGEVVLFDLKAPDTRLVHRTRDEVMGDMAEGRAGILTEHAYDRHPNPARLTDKQKNRRDKLMGLIAPMLERAPDIFDDRIRGKAVADVERRQLATTDKDEKKALASAKTLHQAFDRYWRGGMSPAALVPAFDRCGKGRRKAKPGDPKRGAPVTEGIKKGVNVTPEIETMFGKGLDRYYRSKRIARRKISLKAAYDMMCGDFFLDTVVDPITGKVEHPPKAEWAETGHPTFRQFRYWYDRRDDLLGIRRRREGGSKYDKDMRGIVGTAVAGLMGVGSRFEIDSTPLDIKCVSEVDRTVPVKRPTFYQVTDVLSKMICGIYVGFENASWLAAGLAVRNVVQDKVGFCRQYGVVITPDEWPVEGMMPARFLADRGEFEGYDATGFVEKSTVTVEVASPYRGDQKGSTEKKFDQFHQLLRTQLDGMIEKKVRERGDRDYNRDAILNLSEVTACVIHVALFLNNANKLESYPRTREMVAERVRSVPSELWNWSRERGMDELRRVSVPQIEFAMLPVGKANVEKFGYQFRGIFYMPESAAHMKFFDRARQDGVSKVDVSYDPLWTSRIFLHDPRDSTKHVVLELTDKSSAYAGISFEDWAAIKRDDHVDSVNRHAARHGAMKKATGAMSTIQDAARRERPRPLTAAESQGGRANVDDARRRERADRQRSYKVVNDVEPLENVVDKPPTKPTPTARKQRRDDWLNG